MIEFSLLTPLLVSSSDPCIFFSLHSFSAECIRGEIVHSCRVVWFISFVCVCVCVYVCMCVCVRV